MAGALPGIRVDRALCLGSGMCVVYAPGTFSQDAEAKSMVVDPAGDDPDAIRAAVEACPTGALEFAPNQTEG